MIKRKKKYSFLKGQIHSAKCLLNNPHPIYARRNPVSGEKITFEWMSIDRDIINALSTWNIISCLSWFAEIGVPGIWANSSFIINYKTHFTNKVPVFPVMVKYNGENIFQFDFVRKTNKMNPLNRPLFKMIYIGIRFIQFPTQLQYDFNVLFEKTISYIMDFFARLGNKDPIAFIINANEYQNISSALPANHSVRKIEIPDKKVFKLIVLNRS